MYAAQPAPMTRPVWVCEELGHGARSGNFPSPLHGPVPTAATFGRESREDPGECNSLWEEGRCAMCETRARCHPHTGTKGTVLSAIRSHTPGYDGCIRAGQLRLEMMMRRLRGDSGKGE